jgi:hypothetical protein
VNLKTSCIAIQHAPVAIAVGSRSRQGTRAASSSHA